MRLLCLILVSGCQLVWDPGAYRAEDAQVDAPTDSQLDTAADTDFDRGDSGRDGGLDADVSPDGGGGCDLDSTSGALTYTVADTELVRTRVMHLGSGPALRVTAPRVTIRDVEIIVGAEEGYGIELGPGANDVTIENVRVRSRNDPEMSGPFGHRWALRAAGSPGTRLDKLTVTGLESLGMEGVALEHVQDSDLSGLRIIRPRGVGTAAPSAMVHVGLHVRDTRTVTISDFEISGGDNTHLSYAALFSDNAALTVRDGFSSVVTAQRFAFRAEGVVSSATPNRIEAVQISESFAGIELERTRDWELRDTKVVRRASCSDGDYAYIASGSEEIACINCEYGGACGASPGLELVVAEGDASVGTATPLSFCFDVITEL